jgi:hypothetical protein
MKETVVLKKPPGDAFRRGGSGRPLKGTSVDFKLFR